jgi:hypothetical protein
MVFLLGKVDTKVVVFFFIVGGGTGCSSSITQEVGDRVFFLNYTRSIF